MWALENSPRSEFPFFRFSCGDGMDKTPVTASNIRVRKSFAKNKQVIDIPNLIELQNYTLLGDIIKKDFPTYSGITLEMYFRKKNDGKS